MKYCSNCGYGEPAFEVPLGDSRPRYICHNCDTIHYSNPNVVAGCLCVWEDKVLLCRRAIEPRLGYWNVPSGYLENGETVEEGAAREVWEEAEARVEITGIHSIYSLPHINQIYIHFLADLIDGQFGVGEESSETMLFTEQDIPWKEIAFSSSVFSLKKYFADRKAGIQQPHLGKFDWPQSK
jgi:ADP-ribose pyrophosphatase YjhB (NUDIX family)